MFGHLTVLENVRIALQRQRGNSFDFWWSEKALDAFNDRAMALLEDVGLAEFAAEAAVNLPYGRKRALGIATTLALNPRSPPKRRKGMAPISIFAAAPSCETVVSSTPPGYRHGRRERRLSGSA